MSYVGVVAAGHRATVRSAADILRAGGNAFDAAVAAGFAAAVAEPGLTSLGGGGFLLAKSPGAPAVVFDFFVDTPGRATGGAGVDPHFEVVTVHFPGSDQDFAVGAGSAATPGVVAGLTHVHRRLGRLPIADVVRPAILLCRDGVVVNETQAHVIELLAPILTSTPAAMALYAPAGRLLSAGDVMYNLDCGDFLESIAAGGAGFHEASTASAIAADMYEHDGLIDALDLDRYRVIEREPLSFALNGRRVLTNPPPSLGGQLLARSLEIFEPPPVWGEGDYLVGLNAAMQQIDRERQDPADRPCFERGTTHISVADADGNVASMTCSNGEGSGYIAPGTGVMFNNMLGEDDLHPGGFHSFAPGVRVASMISPALVLDGDDVILVAGSGGSKRIRTAMAQVLLAAVVYGHDVERAVGDPRIHWDGDVCQVEPGFADEAVAELAETTPVNVWPVRNMYFGGAHIVEPGGHAGGDPRRGGTVEIVFR